MVLVVFSSQPAGSSTGGGGTDTFEEAARRLTVADGTSETPRIFLDSAGTLHLAWIDSRGGAPGVYYKSTRNDGFTFTGDRALASKFRSVSGIALAADASSRTIAVAWAGSVGSDGDRVYVRASSDAGRSWGRPAAVGPGGSPALATASGGAVLAYVHGNGSTPTQIRLVALTIAEGGGIRGGRGLLAFNTSATDVALLVLGGTAHVVWVDHVAGWVVLAHVSVNLVSGAASPAHVISTFHGNLAGRVSLAGTGQRLALVWSDDVSSTFDVKGLMSLDGGATWPVSLGIASGPSRSVAPASSLGGTGLLAVAWQDNRTGREQVFARLLKADGNPATPTFRVSASPTAARDPSIALGAGRDLNVAWSDARDASTEIYADHDVLVDRPRIPSLAVYVKRLADTDFASPPSESRAQLLGLIRNASTFVERREESSAVAYLRDQVMIRFDGSSGGDARNDLVVNATAATDLTRLSNGILQGVGGGTRGTRTGEPDPPPPGEGGDPPPEPIPGSGGTAGAKPVVSDVVFTNVASTSATVSWTVFSPDAAISGSFVDWGVASTSEHRTWDNTTPYSVTISPLQAGKTYKVRAGVKWGVGGSLTMRSNTYSLYVGVALDGVRAANVSSDRASIEWTTKVPATTSVSYGKNESNLATTLTGSSGTFHRVNVTGLGLRETYFYRVKSVSTLDSNLWNESGTHSFITEMRIENLTWSESLVAGSFNLTFTWDTNFQGTAEIRYGENTTLISRATGSSGYHHSVKVAGLKSKTAYYWQAFSKATNGSDTFAYESGPTLGTDGTYRPATAPKSESVTGSAPIVTWAISIVNVTVTRGSSWFRVAWNTTYLANASLTWWQGGGTKTIVNWPESALVHSINITGRSPGISYTFALNSTSTSNPTDKGSAPARSVTTTSITISGVSTSTSFYTAWVNWTTSEAGTSVVHYGIQSTWEKTGTSDSGSPHSVTLTGLLSETAYKYCVESASTAHPNDVAVKCGSTFTTLAAPNDANTSTDAGGAFANATHVEPGTWKGWVNPLTPYFETIDFYKFQAFAAQRIQAKMTPGLSYNLDLYLWKPSGALATSSTSGGNGVAEIVSFTAGATEAGFWRVEVRRSSGVGRGDYTLVFNATGGGLERFVVDVGILGGADTDYAAQTPGISVGTNWTARTVSTASSTATDAYIGGAYPDYRQVATANGSFYLNLHRTSWERYNDYLFTLQYYSTQDTNVSVWNGAGWVTLAVVPGQANWRAFSFLLEHTLFYDAEPGRAGLNVKLRCEKAIQLDFISAVPWKHTTYVGNGSDDQQDEYHVSGIRLLDGWVNAGQGYKNATGTGGVIVVTVPDPNAGYFVRMRFDGNTSGVRVERWTGSQWVFTSSASNFTTGEALFVLDPAWYVDAFPTWAGMNVKVRLVPRFRLNETTMFTLEPVQWKTDVGVTGDNVLSSHLPGLSVFPNAEWASPSVVDSRTVRVGQPLADLYLNLPWPTGSMIGYITYKATAGGTVEIKTSSGETWKSVGSIVGDSTWRTAILFLQGAVVGNGGPVVDATRVFHDHFGDAFVNADVRFNFIGGAITLDAMWVDVDGDGDNLTSFGEPHPYGYQDTTLYVLQSGGLQYVDVNWEALVEGRWQVDLSLVLYGSGSNFSGVTASVDGAEIGEVREAASGARSVSWPAMLCTGPRKLRVATNSATRVDVTQIAFRKLPTDPARNDTDGDGLRDGREACGKRTDPTQADTDADGLTDFEETYAFNYNNATSASANATTNVTVNAVGEYRWTIQTSASISNGLVTAVAYLDGQLKWSRTSTSSWTNFQATFDAILPRGLHSLQVQKATAKGTVTLTLVNVTKPSALFTNALYFDTDKDDLSDGDELLGRTGWMTSPNKTDTDGDGALDGLEIRTLLTDPLLKDTDSDGFIDGKDLDPKYDLVVQMRVPEFAVQADPCSNCQYQARVTVGPNWTRSQSGPKNQAVFANHVLSVNVRDDQSASIKLQVFSNAQGTPELDVSTQPGQTAYTRTVDLKAPDILGQVTCGENTGTSWACVWYDIHVIRVGKANTLLMTPNDWSTLSNGTVDGRPTGRHRYVGEQRFVFALLNLTDGNGNLVSYDLESRVSNGYWANYDDLSGNGLNGCVGGEKNASGYFGAGIRLEGSGEYPVVCGTDTSTKLGWINGSFTVGFWVRPDVDYVAGTGWSWSFGRLGGWRLGYFAGTVKLEVRDEASNLHEAKATYPLYAGRWVHLSGTMKTWSTWTNLSLFVNGNLVAWKNESSYAAKDIGSLYLGWDQASGSSAGKFKGLVDEFRLYKHAISQDSIRGLLWFLGGANNVIVPRGVFYGSKLYGDLNGSFSASSPFAGAKAYGNSNTLSSNLNSRVIQMVIAKNLTLAQAWGILDLARTQNGLSNVTSFPFFATSEFYTLGFAWEVSKLASNTSVMNGGNYTASPAPPPSNLWQLFWNTVAGWAEGIWNAVVAVGAFFANVGRWLAQAFMSYVKGLTTGDWTDFKNQVLKPLADALAKFITWILQLVEAVFRALFKPFLDLVDSWIAAVGAAVMGFIARFMGSPEGQPAAPQHSSEMSGQQIMQAVTSLFGAVYFFASLALLLESIILAAMLIEGSLTAASAGTVLALTSIIASLIVGAILGLVIEHVANAVVPDVDFFSPLEEQFETFGSVFQVVGAVLLQYGKKVASKNPVKYPFKDAADGIADAILALMFLASAEVFVAGIRAVGLPNADVAAVTVKFCFDLGAVIMGAFGLALVNRDTSAKAIVKMMHTIGVILDSMAMAVGVMSVIIDLGDLATVARRK